jgi:hypothetical protein
MKGRGNNFESPGETGISLAYSPVKRSGSHHDFYNIHRAPPYIGPDGKIFEMKHAER